MALIDMKAEFRCDSCGRLFSVRVAPDQADSDRSISDVIEEAVEESAGYDGPRGFDGRQDSASIRDGRHLCGPCTSEADEAKDEEEARER